MSATTDAREAVDTYIAAIVAVACIGDAILGIKEAEEMKRLLNQYRDAIQAEERAKVLAKAEPLLRLALWLIEKAQEYHGDVDGGDIQDEATRVGVLAPIPVTASCGEHCVCEEYDNIPGDCYRLTDAAESVRDWLTTQLRSDQ